MSQLVSKILLEVSDEVLNKLVKNPETGRKIKVSSALSYDVKHPAHKAALRMITKSESGPATEPDKKIQAVAPEPAPKENSRSHKPKSASYGVSKECVKILTDKGFKGLNAYPQSFVTPEEIVYNPAAEKNPNSVWVCKFPFILKNGERAMKTAYTAGFMKKSQVKKYKKVSKIKDKDIEALHSKTSKLLQNKDTVLADSACILKIILTTGLRIGSLDADNSSTGNLGVRTLTKDNVSINGDTISLKFLGKSYQENIAVFKDEEVAKYLQKKLSTQQGNNLFSASYGQVGSVMKKINPKGINPKDLRTYKAMSIAKDYLSDKKLGAPPPLPANQKDLKKLVKDKLKIVFEKVAEVLNNSPAMARNSYVHPIVITNFLDKLGLTPKEVGYKHITLEGVERVSEESDSDELPDWVYDDKWDIGVGIQSDKGLDEMFEKYPSYGSDIDTDDISDEDSDECEEYPLPIWFYDDNWDLVPKSGLKESKMLHESVSDFRFSFMEISSDAKGTQWKKNVIATDKKGVKSIIGVLVKEREGYSRNGDRLLNAYRTIYNFSWNRQGVEQVVGHSNFTTGSGRMSKDYDLIHVSGNTTPLTLSWVKEQISKIKNNNNMKSNLVEGIMDDYMNFRPGKRRSPRPRAYSDPVAMEDFMKSKPGDIIQVNNLELIILTPPSRAKVIISCSVVETRNKQKLLTYNASAIQSFKKIGKVTPTELKKLKAADDAITTSNANYRKKNMEPIDYNFHTGFSVKLKDGTTAKVGDKVIVKFSNGNFPYYIASDKTNKSGEIMMKRSMGSLQKARGISPELLLRKA